MIFVHLDFEIHMKYFGKFAVLILLAAKISKHGSFQNILHLFGNGSHKFVLALA